ncbi:tetratricopeptide repeat protein, partial [Moorena sp. SIO3I6]|uniref:tetratricopeptide repeat protein n=1 Tax=Moorena sp. SIO3I6 TaxID=2607831 RepID=UPI0013F75A74
PPIPTRRGPIVSPSRENPYIPYIITPRATLLRTDQPTLRWNGAIGADIFTVQVRGRELNWTEKFSREQVCQENICEAVYSGYPPLQSGIWYKLIISTDTNKSSTEDSTLGLGFKLIDQDEADKIKKITQRIQKENLPKETKALLLARRYADYNLIAGAIEILEELTKHEKIATVDRLLGDLYRQIGLVLEAEVSYVEAVELAETSKNLDELAAAKAGLGEVKYARNNIEEGINLLEEAKKIYENLGDQQRVSKLEEQLEILKP